MLRCPREVREYLGSIVGFCKTMLSYDPNWDSTMDVDEDEDEDGDMLSEDEDEL